MFSLLNESRRAAICLLGLAAMLGLVFLSASTVEATPVVVADEDC